jgi:hypothetical protein
VSLSRGGKTRALQELTKALRLKGVPAVYISLNGKTELESVDNENLVNAVRRRIGFACAPQGTAFDSYNAIPSIESSAPLVLLIDELNNAIFHPSKGNPTSQQQDLWVYLKKNFLIENRVLVFSTHDNGTTTMLARDYLVTSTSNRRVIVRRLPRISTDEEWETVHRHTSLPKLKAACLGFIPAQIVDYASVIQAATTEVENGATEDRVEKFAGSCLRVDDSTPTLDYRIRSRADYFMVLDKDNPTPSSRWVWSPFWILHLLRVCKPVVSEGWTWTRDLCTFTLTRMEQGSEVWELLVTLALILHRLSKEDCEYIKSCTCNLNTFGFHVAPEKVTNTAELVKYLNSGRIDKKYEHLVVFPSNRYFHLYDVVEARKDSGRWELISGYQMKAGKDQQPSGSATIEGASWLVCLKATEETKPTYNWIKLNRSEVQEFLGVSLWDCAEKLLGIFRLAPDDEDDDDESEKGVR